MPLTERGEDRGIGEERPGDVQDWFIYEGHGQPHDGINRLPAPPPWRDMTRTTSEGAGWRGAASRAQAYQVTPETVETVNAALLLRRPLLVTGPPGSGKSSLAYHVARELGLGRVLNWPVTSRTTLKDGLYSYDAIGRLREAGLAAAGRSEPSYGPGLPRSEDIGTYLRLGPLGTALLPGERPRVLLVDELDKSDLDLPNDLLHVFENGEFEIAELARLTDLHTVEVFTHDFGATSAVADGLVSCTAFPFVVMTSNGERDFPAAFLRRCVRLELPEPDVERLTRIVEAYLGPEGTHRGAELIETFVRNRSEGLLSTDQLLNAIFLLLGDGTADGRADLLRRVLRPLGPGV